MIKNKLISILEEVLETKLNNINDKSFNLKKDLNMDSIQIVEMLIKIENEFNITFKEEYLTENVLTDFEKLLQAIKMSIEE